MNEKPDWLCPNCKGKGHVFDAAATIIFGACLLGLPILLAPFETNDKRGMSRHKCVHCDGTGFVRPPSIGAHP